LLVEFPEVFSPLPGQVNNDMFDLVFGDGVHPGDILIAPFREQDGGAMREVKAGVGKFMESGSGVLIVRFLLDRVLDDTCFGLAGGDDDRHRAGIIGDGIQTDCDHQPVAGDLDAAEVRCGSGLGFVVGGGQTGGRKVV